MGLEKLRNLAIVAHIDAGKTTTTERILHCAGVEARIGQVDDGTAVMDWMEEERQRGITITAAATHFTWGGSELSLIDTPGHVDFTMEVERCMRVLDGAILVIDAVSGVQAQSETVWRQMRTNGVPSICFVNKCDRVGADYLAASESVRRRLGAPAVPVQYPIFDAEGRMVGVVDLVRMRAFQFDDAGSIFEAEIPASLSDEVMVLRAELIDVLADEDEALLQAVVEEREPELAVLQAGIRRRVVDGSLVPVLCGAALRGVGVQPLLDAAVAYLPSPLDRPPVEGFDKDGAPGPSRGPDPDGPFAALAFKLHTGPHGDQTFLRVYSGRVAPGQKVWNPRARKMERVARILRKHADHGESLDGAEAGSIVAVTGLRETATGDTLCDRADVILLEPPVFPEPVIALMIEPASSADRERLRTALARLVHEDPSFRVSEDEHTGQWRIEGMGELHLEVQVHRLQREFNVEARVGSPRVSYREAVRSSARGNAKVDRILGGKSVFGAVEVSLEAAHEMQETPGGEPDERLGAALAPRIEWGPGCAVPEAFRGAVEEALALEASSGPRFGFPLVGCRIRVVGGESCERDAEVAFAQAATQALRKAMQSAEVEILEPTMAFDIQVPEEFSSGVIADLGSRHAEVEEVLSEGDLRTIRGRVPLVHMFGYSTVVRSLSQGRGSYGMIPAGFTELPAAELEARGLIWS